MVLCRPEGREPNGKVAESNVAYVDSESRTVFLGGNSQDQPDERYEPAARLKTVKSRKKPAPLFDFPPERDL